MAKLITMVKSKLEEKYHFKPFAFNTGTIFDLFTGKHVFNANEKKYYLNGGLMFSIGIAGKQNTFKSSLAYSLLARCMLLYPQIETIIYDTELALGDEQRPSNLIGDFFVPKKQNKEKLKESLKERILIVNRAQYTLDSFYELLLELKANKQKHIDDYVIKTPFTDPKTGKEILTIAPTFVVIDSWTDMQSSAELDLIDQSKMKDGKLQTVFMVDGQKKTVFMRTLPNFYLNGGFYFILTAHIGKSVQMSPFEPVEKDLTFMKHGEKIKGTGSEFLFLTTTLFDTRKVSVLQDSKKECLFPYPLYNNNIELNEVTTVICRSKLGASGYSIPVIISQYDGYLEYLTCYWILDQYLKKGIEGERSKKCSLLPSIKFNRKNLRETLENNYELCRAIQILAHYYLLKDIIGFHTSHIPKKLTPISIEQFIEELLRLPPDDLKAILNSKFYWTTDDSGIHPKEHYSLVDIFIKTFNQ